MRNKLLIIIFILSFHAQQNVAQTIDFSNYTRLQCAGPIPADFTTLSSEKYEQSKAQINKKQNMHDRLIEQQFYLQSNFAFDRLLLSGKVFFGDPVTIYLNKIKDELLKDQPGLRDSIRIYTLKSNEANAFTNNNGVVLVTTGLIAQVQNEAQLAFILSHEFIHYIKKHSLSIFTETRKMEQGSGIYKKLDNNQLELSAFSYSKDMEKEADAGGWEIYKKSKFNLQSVRDVFSVMLYSYLPFDEIKFQKTFFEDSVGYIFPEKYFLDSLKSITAEEDYDDSYSDHPNIRKRKDAILELMEGAGDSGKVAFLQPKSDFDLVQKICRYEFCVADLNHQRYEDAIYAAYILLQADPNNFFPKKVIAESLYGLSHYRASSSSRNNYESYTDQEGNIQEVFHLMQKLPSKDLNVLALKYCWNLHRQNPTDNMLNEMCSDLFNDLIQHNSLREDDFLKAYPKEEKQDTAATKTTDVAGGSKYDKIKKDKDRKVVAGAIEYYKLAFVNYLSQTEFTDAFDKAKKIADSIDNRISVHADKKKKKDDGYALNVDKLLVINPVYIKVDESQKTPVEYLASESAELNLNKLLTDNAKLLKLDLSFLESNNLGANDVDKFNDLALLNDWFSEKINEDEISLVNSNEDGLKDMKKKYNVDDFAWFGVVSLKQKRTVEITTWCYSILFWPTLPFVIYYAMQPDYRTYFFTYLIDASTGKIKMKYVNVAHQNDSQSVQQSNIYYILQQIKSKRK